jgi:hypothetical protein
MENERRMKNESIEIIALWVEQALINNFTTKCTITAKAVLERCMWL